MCKLFNCTELSFTIPTYFSLPGEHGGVGVARVKCSSGSQVGNVQRMVSPLRLPATQDAGDGEGRVSAGPGVLGVRDLWGGAAPWARRGSPPLRRRTDVNLRRRTHLAHADLSLVFLSRKKFNFKVVHFK